ATAHGARQERHVRLPAGLGNTSRHELPRLTVDRTDARRRRGVRRAAERLYVLRECLRAVWERDQLLGERRDERTSRLFWISDKGLCPLGNVDDDRECDPAHAAFSCEWPNRPRGQCR